MGILYQTDEEGNRLAVVIPIAEWEAIQARMKAENAVDHLIDARGVLHLGDYRLRVLFSDGAVRDVDLQNNLCGPMFEPLKDEAFFAQVFVDPETCVVSWPNGADVATDALYEMGVSIASAVV